MTDEPRVALVAGATRGVGRAIAVELARAAYGWDPEDHSGIDRFR